MYQDPRCTKYRKPRSFYGTTLGKYINVAIGISCVIVYTFSYGLSCIQVLRENVKKFRYEIDVNIIGNDMIQWNLEQKLLRRLEIKEEVEKAKYI